jgi:hypothetical protein
MKILTTIITILVLSIAAAGAFCADKSSTLLVSANVLPAAKYEILHQEDSYTVTVADIDKGYIDIGNALTYSVWTNSRNGYLLTFAFDNRSIKEIKIIDTHNSYLISNNYQEVHMPHPGMKYVTKELYMRLFLLTDTKPGTYQMPLAMTISAM